MTKSIEPLSFPNGLTITLDTRKAHTMAIIAATSIIVTIMPLIYVVISTTLPYVIVILITPIIDASLSSLYIGSEISATPVLVSYLSLTLPLSADNICSLIIILPVS